MFGHKSLFLEVVVNAAILQREVEGVERGGGSFPAPERTIELKGIGIRSQCQRIDRSGEKARISVHITQKFRTKGTHHWVSRADDVKAKSRGERQKCHRRWTSRSQP